MLLEKQQPERNNEASEECQDNDYQRGYMKNDVIIMKSVRLQILDESQFHDHMKNVRKLQYDNGNFSTAILHDLRGHYFHRI